jgi:methionine biosynthesis protein MetW
MAANSDMADLIDRLPDSVRKHLDPAYGECGRNQLSRLCAVPGEAIGRGSRDAAEMHRWQDGVIEELIPGEASVLDLGCGNGELLWRLMKDKNVRGQGVEVDFDSVVECIRLGIPVMQADLDEGLTGFPNGSFDYVILEETVQTLFKPLDTLREMLRVGRRGLVSFPNFGSWNVRFELAVRGRMPVTEDLPYHWYDTPNIHLLTLQDFHRWAGGHRVRITAGYVLASGGVRPMDYPRDNLLADEVLLAIEPDL